MAMLSETPLGPTISVARMSRHDMDWAGKPSADRRKMQNRVHQKAWREYVSYASYSAQKSQEDPMATSLILLPDRRKKSSREDKI